MKPHPLSATSVSLLSFRTDSSSIFSCTSNSQAPVPITVTAKVPVTSNPHDVKPKDQLSVQILLSSMTDTGDHRQLPMASRMPRCWFPPSSQVVPCESLVLFPLHFPDLYLIAGPVELSSRTHSPSTRTPLPSSFSNALTFPQ